MADFTLPHGDSSSAMLYRVTKKSPLKENKVIPIMVDKLRKITKNPGFTFSLGARGPFILRSVDSTLNQVIRLATGTNSEVILHGSCIPEVYLYPRSEKHENIAINTLVAEYY